MNRTQDQGWLRSERWPEYPAGAPRPVRARTPWAQLPSGLVVPEDCVPAPRPLAIDLFCGAGGFSLGLIEAGYAVVLAADHDPEAAITYLYNLGSYPCQFHWVESSDEAQMKSALSRQMKRKTKGQRVQGAFVSGGSRGGRDMAPGYKGVGHFVLGDIAKVKGADLCAVLGIARGDLDLLVGGPPCQGFSTAGKREVVDPRNSLVFEFVRLACELRPKAVAMENVEGMLSMVTPDGALVVDELARILEQGEYTSYEAARRILSDNPAARRIGRGPGAVVTGKRHKRGRTPEPTPEPSQPQEASPVAPAQGFLFERGAK